MELSWRLTILTCENCGVELPEGASFCAHCGSPVSVAQIGPVYVPRTAEPAEETPAAKRFAVPQPHPTYAGFWLRALAFLIDIFILSFVFTMITSFNPSLFIVFPDPNAKSVLALPQPTLLGFLALFLMMWLYYALFEASPWQATPGKRLLRLYVTDLNGRPITFWRASLRYLGRKISELTFLVGYLVAGFTDKKQALHDIIAGCLVLRRP